MGRRNSAETFVKNLPISGPGNESGMYEKEPIIRMLKMKPSKDHNRRLTMMVKERKTEKSNNSRNHFHSMFGSSGRSSFNKSVISSPSNHKFSKEEIGRLTLLNNISPNSGGSKNLPTKSGNIKINKLNSPKGLKHSKMMTTESMFALFRDITKKVNENLNNKSQAKEPK
jgi:hypothetical protein